MWKVLLLMLIGLAGLTGCAGTEVSAVGVELTAQEYGRAFQAARDVLRDRRFLLDRVDAPQGVVTTQPKSEPGLAKPWEAPPGLDQAAEDLFQRQQRVVRIAFTPKGLGEEGRQRFPVTDPLRDLVDQPTDTVMTVRVGVERVERPGYRVNFDAVRLATQTIDPELEAKGLMPRYVVALREDPALAGEILREIVARVNASR